MDRTSALTRMALLLSFTAAVSSTVLAIVLRKRSAVGTGAAVITDSLMCPESMVCIPMSLSQGRQLTISGSLWNTPCTFLMDTGFTYSVLSASYKTASDGNLDVKWLGSWHRVKLLRWIMTAQSKTNRLPLVQLGDWATTLGPHGTPISLSEQPALIQDLGTMLDTREYDIPLGGILGASFMSQFVVTFDYKNKCISYMCSLSDVSSCVVLKNEAAWHLGVIVVPVTCTMHGVSRVFRACIDTGAGASILSKNVTKALLPHDHPARSTPGHASFGDSKIDAFAYTKDHGPSLSLSFNDSHRVVVVDPDTCLLMPERSSKIAALAGHDMLLGTAFLKNIRLTVDYTVSPTKVYICNG
jgi:hypothetical protein